MIDACVPRLSPRGWPEEDAKQSTAMREGLPFPYNSDKCLPGLSDRQ